MNSGEIDIIKRCQAGEYGYFAQLYDLYIDKIYRFVYYKIRHRETAEDLTSDTFAKALEKISSYDPVKSPFSVWVYRIARNTVIDHYRTAKPNLNIEDSWDVASDENVPRQVDASMNLREVESYLAKLTAEQREIVVLRVWEGLSYREIAEIIGKTEDSAKMMFSRTVRKMRESLGPLAVTLILLLK